MHPGFASGAGEVTDSMWKRLSRREKKDGKRSAYLAEKRASLPMRAREKGKKTCRLRRERGDFDAKGKVTPLRIRKA